MVRVAVTNLLVCLLPLLITLPAGAETPAERWVSRFRFEEPPVEQVGVCTGTVGALPSFKVQPSQPGQCLVRVSLPFAAAALPDGMGLTVHAAGGEVAPDLRVLTRHPGTPSSIRRAIITFPYNFPELGPHKFNLTLAPAQPAPRKQMTQDGDAWTAQLGDTSVSIRRDRVAVSLAGQRFAARLIAPACASNETPVPEVVEWDNYYAWLRLLAPDHRWPRIIEVRIDFTGNVAVQAHVQRLEKGDATAPELGWEIASPPLASTASHSFLEGDPCTLATTDNTAAVSFPTAPGYRRGRVDAANDNGAGTIRYIRCAKDDNVPFQETAWRSAAFVVSKQGAAPLNALFEPALDVCVFTAAVPAQNLELWPVLKELQQYTRDAIAASMVYGDDFGNVTAFNENAPAGVFGMNRLNHCGAIFDEAERGESPALRQTALLWCSNMYDLSTWWADAKEFGGTRYNNATAAGSKDHVDDTLFMWRGNNAVHFCTKGFENYVSAYEETGDPRMLAALRAQTAYAFKYIHTDQGECRNIGDVADFMALYRTTGRRQYLDEALRLFRELRAKLSPGDLFSQGGQPIAEDGPFIDDDQHGYEAPFAKPYIIGYALAGLPDLLRECPDEPKLRDVVCAVADFMADSQDALGGWRYPHPKSSWQILSQAIEHAAQLARAAAVLEERGEPVDNLLDAIERTLQQRVNGFARTGTILAGLGGWESKAGVVREGQTIYDLYKKPADRDPSRDYTEGEISLGNSAPEGLVYFTEVLEFYLAQRPAERLFHSNDQLAAVLERTEQHHDVPEPQRAEPLRYGVKAELPHFRDAQVARLDFPMSRGQSGLPFTEWRARARETFLSCLPPRPALAPFDPQVVAVEDRGAYEARKIALNLSQDARVLAYLLVPKGQGPFPAILALHDHGAHFSIGKEKVVRPFDEPADRIKDAEKWVCECYGGVFIGDELAARGYVVFAADALYWGDRGRAEGVSYEAQQALAANLLQLGYTWAGLILWDDIRSAEFVQGLEEVDPDRIGAVGLSMGSYRTWSLAAATDIVKAGAAICWMGDTPTLTSIGNNQTRGQSAYSMIHPNLRNYLDYPDVASIACPKPMLFYNGRQDALFPIPGVEACYEKLQRVWRDQGVENRLVTKLWDVPHVFNRKMQAQAFQFLDTHLKAK
ncbi:MAG TPA: dienelactone hydrolase family protein [Candidatus Bathyarchaeia archaeon]|nr:dienelactone hydrolase family protein [Candidatus Bathyarchaeia archaeon]